MVSEPRERMLIVMKHSLAITSQNGRPLRKRVNELHSNCWIGDLQHRAYVSLNAPHGCDALLDFLNSKQNLKIHPKYTFATYTSISRACKHDFVFTIETKSAPFEIWKTPSGANENGYHLLSVAVTLCFFLMHAENATNLCKKQHTFLYIATFLYIEVNLCVYNLYEIHIS